MADLQHQPLKGTVALVSGASAGIGASTARALAVEGAAVALLARREERLTSVAEDIERAGGTALVVAADITEAGRAAEAVSRTVDELGRLDIVVNCAGIALVGPMVDAPEGEWTRMIDLNLSGLLAVTHAAVPHLLAAAGDDPRRVADLVNISSVAGRRAQTGAGIYAATKAAVCSLSEALRQEITRRHVRVGLVEPGAVRTEWALSNRPELHESLAGKFDGMEQLEAEDIAEAVVFMVTRHRRTAVNEILVRPTDQAN